MSIGLNALASRSQLLFLFNRSERWLLSSSLHYTSRRFRSGKFIGREKPDQHQSQQPRRKYDPRGSKPAWFQKKATEIPQLNLSLNNPAGIIQHFEDNVEDWSERPLLHARLLSFGIPEDDIYPLLAHFVSEVTLGKLSTPEAYERYSLDRFARYTPEDLPWTYTDIVCTGIFFDWAAEPAHKVILENIVSPSTLGAIHRLFQAARCEHPSDSFWRARRTRRKIIMHVGPTNSGKTHHALRALAAAHSGVYAGPLRLLAHEIWERLNLGQIVPAGIEDEAEIAPSNVESALDISPPGNTTPAVRNVGNPKFVRHCNMITGEEHKIVNDEATLESATVEMLSMSKKYDVAVIDEIQMIANVERGFAWTCAVLGIDAKEVHLCGEETAVPLVEAILADTNDELIVRRYNRLTPLAISPSLKSWKNVQKGDCIVTFSRNNIFFVKNAVEKATSMKCAVVYGKLPPEIRSGQADLFNDPNSGYDVIVGSDAIGMGLNLYVLSNYRSTFQPLTSSSQENPKSRLRRRHQIRWRNATTSKHLPNKTDCWSSRPIRYGARKKWLRHNPQSRGPVIRSKSPR